jgi:hypothetical protein
MAAIRLFFSSRALYKAQKETSNRWFQCGSGHSWKIYYFFIKKLNIMHPWATGEASCPELREHPAHQNNTMLNFFSFFVGIFCHLDPDPADQGQCGMRIHADPDPHCLTNWENITKNIKILGNYLMEEPKDEVFFSCWFHRYCLMHQNIYVYLTCFNLKTKKISTTKS